jgi:glycosyltransferase involved in cell wall biosynthesis
MSKLAIDVTFKPTGGVLTQINQLILNIDSYEFNEIIFYTTHDNALLFENLSLNNVTIKYVLFSSKSLILRAIWAQIFLPLLLVLNQIDLLFCPGNISPIVNTRKKVQWIHTIGPFEKNFISSFAFRERCILSITKYLMIISSYTSNMVVFDSYYTRELFVRKFNQKKEKSFVIHSGNDNFFKPVFSNNSKLFSTIGDKSFILNVSHLYPYKNLELLIDSFNNLELHKKGLYLVIAGSISDKKYYSKLQLILKKYEISQYVIFLGRLEIEELRELYSQCKIFVFTSPFENFAYTLVEALCCSAAIVTTNTTAMPESCGDAALYFSPDSEKELSNCIMSYLSNEEVRMKYKTLALLKSNSYPNYSYVNNETNRLLKSLI